ncbi:MAG: riboflavin synthase, partial [Mariprofundaceae bacterium]|nr:riboflavin synthase [Mariprofundaceae bacterium]
MFTGIIQDVGEIRDINHEEQQSHLSFESSLKMSRWQLGDSVAVDGCCLTITDFPNKNTWSATLSLETLALTTFSDAKIGKKVNMEPALCVGDALGGHIVTGHIDGLAMVKNISNIGEHKAFTFTAPQALARYIVKKGSVTLNGTSLTVNDVDECCFTVNLIPHTLSHTNLGQLQENDHVNIETDMLGRYVERIMYFQNKSEETK